MYVGTYIHNMNSKQNYRILYKTFERKPLATNGATSEGLRPLVSGK